MDLYDLMRTPARPQQTGQPPRNEKPPKKAKVKDDAVAFPLSSFVFGRFYLICMFNYLGYLAGERNSYTDTFPPHAESAD